MGCGSSVNQLQTVVVPNQQNKQSSNNHILIQTKKSINLEQKQIQSSKINNIESNKKFQQKQQLKIKQQNNKLQKNQTKYQQKLSSFQNEVNNQKKIQIQSYHQQSTNRAFIFGQSQQQRKLIMLQCQNMQFSIISSKGNINTPHKYQPKQIIFQQSQQLIASALFNSHSHPPYNFMFATYISPQTIFLCGGVNYSFDYITQEAFIFKTSSVSLNSNKKRGNTLVGNKFQKLPCMHQKRYSHMGVFLKINGLSYVFIFGGRGLEQQILSTCEMYSLTQRKWKDLPAMPRGRSTAFSLIFKGKIFIFGGYTGQKKRSKKIDVFDPVKLFWQTLDVKLHRGIQTGYIFSPKSNQILVLGGNMEMGSLKTVIRINLVDWVYNWDSNMKHQRLLQKAIKYQDALYVFGGDFQDTCQKYTIKQKKWKDFTLPYSQFISVDDINSFQMANQTLNVIFEQPVQNKNQILNYDRQIIFGSDNFPCILEINTNKWVLRRRPVPMALRLRANMNVVKIQEGKYFICGGIDCFKQKPSRACYIYYPGTNKAIQIAKMSCKKYECAVAYNNNYIYIFGGKNQKGQILHQSEKYSLNDEKWQKISDLNSERAGGKTVVINNNILIVGGRDSIQSLNSIQVLDIETQTIWTYNHHFTFSSDIKFIFKDQNSNGIYMLTHNQILHKHNAYYLKIDINHKQNQTIQQNVKEILSQQQIKGKIPPFNHAFKIGKKVVTINNKGFSIGQIDQNTKQFKFESLLVINQVEVIQFPLQSFSSN